MQTEQLPRLEAGEYPGGIWYYEPHTYLPYRYVLGRVGRHPLVCIGINPSTAQPGALDPTLRSVERLAAANGFDSWIMFNVYPQRATDPNDMDKTPDRALCDENLRKAHQRAVDRGIAMRMVFAQHVAHDAGALAVGLVRGDAQLVHGVEDTAVHRLEAVAHIRQGTPDNDAHGIFDIAFFHFADQLGHRHHAGTRPFRRRHP